MTQEIKLEDKETDNSQSLVFQEIKLEAEIWKFSLKKTEKEASLIRVERCTCL